MYICIYIRHTLIVWGRFLWFRPHTTSHVVLVWPRGDRDMIVWDSKWSRPEPRGIGPTRERKWKQRDTASEESKAKEKESDRLRKKQCIQGESGVTPHLAHFLKLFRPPLCHVHRYLHIVTMDIYLHISGYPSTRGKLCACVFLLDIHTMWQSRVEIKHSVANFNCITAFEAL